MPWTKVHIEKDEFTKTLGAQGLRGRTYREAILEAQRQMLASDKRVFLMGEGIDDPGGVFGSTVGLASEFGRERVMDIPIAENGLTGIAIGAAAAGMRPVFIHMRMDFLPMCMDQIVNHAAKWNYMTGGSVNVPLVIRSIIGRGWGSAAQHSQALHPLFMPVPGLKIVMPATPYDAKGMLIGAVQDGNPVLYIEHRWLYEREGYVPEEQYAVKPGEAVVRREGRDVTLVAVSFMLYEAMRAAGELAKEGIEVEVIDPRSVKPLDIDTIAASVRKTGRLVIADVACPMGGLGAEVACAVMERMSSLKSPVQRVNFPEAPTPCSPVLEEAYYPGYKEIVNTVRRGMK